MLPVFRPLKDRGVLTVWSGLCASSVGEDLFRVASVWLAVEVAGNMVGLVTGRWAPDEVGPAVERAVRVVLR